MLLLIRQPTAVNAYNNILFTFHYASTYTSNLACISSSSSYLHSTMLLLIQSQLLRFTVCIAFTFHYASTYTNPCVDSFRDLWLIYIPLCFYLYVTCCIICKVKKWIYIPLCFYLYDQAGAVRVLTGHIYIPLCFYLYMLPSYGKGRIAHIYIPLCFYLYVSACLLNAFSAFDLHSTMLLLIHQKTVIRAVKENIYIPLCFYLYACPKEYIHLFWLFTFHYASTYTQHHPNLRELGWLIYIPLCFYLYITISSTIRNSLIIYIPLCFYLYGLLMFAGDIYFLIYIPLCFYLYKHFSKMYGKIRYLFTFHYASTYTIV